MLNMFVGKVTTMEVLLVGILRCTSVQHAQSKLPVSFSPFHSYPLLPTKSPHYLPTLPATYLQSPLSTYARPKHAQSKLPVSFPLFHCYTLLSTYALCSLPTFPAICPHPPLSTHAAS